MGATSSSFYEPAVSTEYLRRLELIDLPDEDAISMTLALGILRWGGLAAEESRLEPGGIVGGLESFDTGLGIAFKEAFLISPRDGSFLATVTGPGNLCSEEVVESMEDAARSVIKTYRDRGKISA